MREETTSKRQFSGNEARQELEKHGIPCPSIKGISHFFILVQGNLGKLNEPKLWEMKSDFETKLKSIPELLSKTKKVSTAYIN